MYSTGNYTQYSVMAYLGKESKKEWRYIYIYIYIYIHIHTYTHTTNSFCCTSESSTF